METARIMTVFVTLYLKLKSKASFNDFSSKKSPAFEEHFQENISGLKLSDENLPNWNDNYIWKQMELYENALYIVFDTDTDTLFIMQKTQ